MPVSGAFHTELMESATEPLQEVLRQVEVSQTLIWSYTIYSYIRQKTIKNGKDLLVPVAQLSGFDPSIFCCLSIRSCGQQPKQRGPSPWSLALPGEPSRVARFGGFGLDCAG